jgi:hypothetical protein
MKPYAGEYFRTNPALQRRNHQENGHSAKEASLSALSAKVVGPLPYWHLCRMFLAVRIAASTHILPVAIVISPDTAKVYSRAQLPQKNFVLAK